jgi:hypothetical protein
VFSVHILGPSNREVAVNKLKRPLFGCISKCPQLLWLHNYLYLSNPP